MSYYMDVNNQYEYLLRCKFKKEYDFKVLKEMKEFNKQSLKFIDTKHIKNLFLDNLFTISNLTERLVISLKLYCLNGCHNVNPFVSSMHSYKYICKNGYLDRLKKNDIKNKYYCKDMKKAPYTKYQSWKKEELVKHIQRLELQLWNREFVIRKMEMKYNIDNCGVVIFE